MISLNYLKLKVLQHLWIFLIILDRTFGFKESSMYCCICSKFALILLDIINNIYLLIPKYFIIICKFN